MKLIKDEQGQASGLLLSVIVLAVLFVGVAIFAIWAFGGRQDYKNNVDAKIQAAKTATTKAVQTADAKQYAEAAKQPLKTYVGPDAYGSVHIMYPKTWSAYINTSDSSAPLDAYFHADYLPSVDDSNSTFNLRVQVSSSSYDSVVSQYNSQVQQGQATATPYKLAKVPSVVGMKFDGQIFNNNASGSLVVLPLRSQTLEIWANDPAFLSDFNTLILPNLSFSP
jgi:hypothetical protein